MQSYYEINVALNNSHLFATAERSAVTLDQLARVLAVIVAKFPESEGYNITASRINVVGQCVDVTTILKKVK